MRKNVWIILALLLVIPGLLFTVSCAKKTVKSDATAAVDTAKQEEVIKARQAAIKAAEEAKKEELARKAAEEAARKKAAEEAARQAALAAQKAKEDAEKRKILSTIQLFESEDIYFEYDKDRLLSTARELLQKKAQWLRDNPEAIALIEGHCDERGTNEYNLALGERRARSAKTFLTDLDISSSRLTTISYGEERPVDSGQTEEAWSKNRRAHFEIE